MGRIGWIIAASAISVVALASVGGYVATRYASAYVETRLQAETGRHWTVSGTPGLTFSPDFAILVRHASARVALEADADATFRAESVRVSGRPWDLVRTGRVTGVEIDSPTAQVPANYWRYIDIADALRGTERSGPARTESSPDRITVRNGRIQFVGASHRVQGEIDGVSFETIRAAGGRETTFGMRVREAELQGEFSFDVSSPDGRTPIRFGITAPGLLPNRISGNLESAIESGRISLSRLTGSVGSDRFSGAALIDLNAKPVIRLDLGFQNLALPMPQPGQRRAWGGGPDDLTFLGGFDGRVSAYAANLRVGSVSLTECTAEMEVNDGRVTAALSQASVYGGQATAKLGASSQDGILRHSFQAEFKDVRTLPLLSDVAGATLLDGTAALAVNTQGSGRISDDVLSGLSGSASLLVRNGRLNTVDLPGLAQMAISQLPTYSSRSDADTTAFDDVSASFRISGGKALTEDFALNGPMVVASGAGSIDLVSRTLSFRLEPRLVNLKGAANPLSALRVPVVIEGPLSALRIHPDLAGAAAAPITSGNGPLAPLGGMNLDKLLDAILPPNSGSRASPSSGQRGREAQQPR